MAKSILKSKSSPRRLVFYEIVGDLLIKHNLKINDQFRRMSVIGFPGTFCAKVIWPSEYDPFLFGTQYDWLSDDEIVWKNSKPFQDLLDIRNKNAVKSVTKKGIISYDDKFVKPYMSFTNFGSYGRVSSQALWHFMTPEEFIRTQNQALETFIMGNVRTQPITIEKLFYYPSSEESFDTYYIPTQDYICDNNPDTAKQGRGIMPGIIQLSEDQFLSHLIDIGDYSRFSEELKKIGLDRTTLYNIALNYIYVKQEEIPLSLLPEQEKRKAIKKAQKDSTVLELVKRVRR